MPNYKTNGSWTAIPTAALWTTYRGTFHVEHPKATEFTGNGLPCGAFGLPRIVIHAPFMSGTGFAFWRDLFALATDLSTSIYIEALNPNTGAVEKFTGTLLRPAFDGVSWGSTADKTMYRSVAINIINVTATT